MCYGVNPEAVVIRVLWPHVAQAWHDFFGEQLKAVADNRARNLTRLIEQDNLIDMARLKSA